jgi:hypothetical protein
LTSRSTVALYWIVRKDVYMAASAKNSNTAKSGSLASRRRLPARLDRFDIN